VKEKELIQVLSRLYPSTRWPKPFNLLQGSGIYAARRDIKAAARQVGTTSSRLNQFRSSRNRVVELFGTEKPDEQVRRRVRQILGNLIVGRCGEITFEELYKQHVQTTELELRDLREGRSDTDYRLFNGKNRPVYRVNIKYHGSLFQRAKEMVGLEPEDCFALATYKIAGALQKQSKDELPYIFVIVSVPNLTAESIGASVPSDLQDFLALCAVSDRIPKKRDLEDQTVNMLQKEKHPAFDRTLKRIAEAHWYVLSARKADKLLREMLFERVFALRTPGFARQFGTAELNMHFSLSQDLTLLVKYLETLREAGYPRVTTLLERGDY
jgi:hypothetical protein